MAKKFEDPKECMTPKFRVSFPNVFKPKSYEGGDPKYSITMLFPKKTDLAALKAAAKAAGIEEWGPVEKWPKKNGKLALRMPFRDGDEDKPDMDGYADHMFVTASSKSPPQVVGIDGVTRLNSEADLYAGCYARATIRAFPYDIKGNKGISFGLTNIQKWEDGEPFSGKPKAEDEFESLESENSDSESTEEADPFA